MTLGPKRHAHLLTMLGKVESAIDAHEEMAKDGNFQAITLGLVVLRNVVRINRRMVRDGLDPAEVPQEPVTADLEEVGVVLGSLWGPALESLANRRALVCGLFGPKAHVRVPKSPRRFQMGVVPAAAIEGSPGRRLDASYHLDTPEARSKARRT